MSICVCRATVSVASERHGGIVQTTDELLWMDTDSLGRTSQDSEEGEGPLREKAVRTHRALLWYG